MKPKTAGGNIRQRGEESLQSLQAEQKGLLLVGEAGDILGRGGLAVGATAKEGPPRPPTKGPLPQDQQGDFWPSGQGMLFQAWGRGAPEDFPLQKLKAESCEVPFHPGKGGTPLCLS